MNDNKNDNKNDNITVIAPHLWTNGGDKVLLLKRLNADGTSYQGHRWPEAGDWEEKNWNDRKECGGGIHAWPWGMGLGEDSDFDLIGDIWVVLAADPTDIVGELENGCKCKARLARQIYRGDFAGAWAQIHDGRDALIVAMAQSGLPSSSSGYFSTAASSGYSSTAASSGDSSKAASSGTSSKAASSGDSSTAASSGDSSTAASSGYSSTAASSGYSSKAASSGYSSTAASSGDYSKAASSGDYSTAASSGDYSKAASSGDYSTAASSGDYSTAASSGDYSKAASSGDNTLAAVVGFGGAVRVGPRGAFAITYEAADGPRFLTGKAGENGIKADTWYEVVDGVLVEKGT